MLSLEDLVVCHGRVRVIDGLSVEIGAGATAVLGLNASGKSTLFRALAGAQAIRSGRVMIDGSPLNADDKRVRLAPQNVPATRHFDVQGVLEYLALLDGVSRHRLADAVDNAIAVTNLEASRHQRLSELSGGTARRLSLAQALLIPSRYLLLDEPTSGLDPVQREGIHQLIGSLAKDCAVVFSTHYPDEVRRLASRFLVIRGGRLHADGEGRALSDAEARALLGQDA